MKGKRWRSLPNGQHPVFIGSTYQLSNWQAHLLRIPSSQNIAEIARRHDKIHSITIRNRLPCDQIEISGYTSADIDECVQGAYNTNFDAAEIAPLIKLSEQEYMLTGSLLFLVLIYFIFPQRLHYIVIA